MIEDANKDAIIDVFEDAIDDAMECAIRDATEEFLSTLFRTLLMQFGTPLKTL